MGVRKGISHNEFPKQSPYLNKRADVAFNYETQRTILGVIVRDDREEPWITILKLSDGRYVLATECQYSLPR